MEMKEKKQKRIISNLPTLQKRLGQLGNSNCNNYDCDNWQIWSAFVRIFSKSPSPSQKIPPTTVDERGNIYGSGLTLR